MAMPADSFMPNASLDPVHLDDPSLYLNRELTWLRFNERVLHEAEIASNPLLEKLKFIAIVSSNLDEFFMKRIGGLKEQVGAGVQELTLDGRNPQQQIDECAEHVRALEARKSQLLPKILNDLHNAGIRILNYQDLKKSKCALLRDYYIHNIFPLVTPQSIDPAHPFPFISNLSLNLLVTLRHPKNQQALLARVKVPIGNGIHRFIALEKEDRQQNYVEYVRLEDIIGNNLDILFPGMEVLAYECFHVTRNSNTERDESNADDLLELIESELRDRKFAPIVRIVVEHNMDTQRRQFLINELGLQQQDVYDTEHMMALRDLWELVGIERPDLHDTPHHPLDHPLLSAHQSIFTAIRENNGIFLHHPYDSFATSVERLVKEARHDPAVRAIKMTIYRTSKDTKIIEYLIDAARNGKQVAVVMELKARFDEAANIHWANSLEEAGIHVTYGVVGLKTHAKVILVVRQEEEGLRRYMHIGTGNYHAGTARLYTDVGLLTCDTDIAHDVSELFNFLTTGYTPKRDYRKLLPAPTLLKQNLIKKINREIAHAKEGKKTAIQFKMNALEDIDICKALYQASQAGVTVQLIVRDTCRLRPGIKDISDNIHVISIVGRFLEHARIYYFYNNGQEEYYIGSADLMMRNLERRVEVVTPVEPEHLSQHLRTILDINLADQRNVWEMQADGHYLQRQPKDAETKGCQELFIELAQKRGKTRLAKSNKGLSKKRRKRQGV
ncbi:MAG: polyphosphate kinase 1 [Gammaproteobacteria bacterium]|nr:polyphosphate kinase 1 [Gammaproteobacteria bacterium]